MRLIKFRSRQDGCIFEVSLTIERLAPQQNFKIGGESSSRSNFETEWLHSMIDAASRADLHAIDSLMRREGHYHWIQNEHLMILLNQRDERSGLSVMHAAVNRIV